MFDQGKFNRTKFTPRTREIPVEELQTFFGEDPPVWVIRNLSGEELGKVNEAAEQVRGMTKVVEVLAKGEQGEAVKEMLGLGKSVPADLAKRIAALMCGSIKPEIDRPTAVRLFENFPLQAFNLTNNIFDLTEMGASPGK